MYTSMHSLPSKDPFRTPSKSKLLHHLTTSPPRASYLDQKAHMFAVQTPKTGSAHSHARLSHEEEQQTRNSPLDHHDSTAPVLEARNGEGLL